MHKIARMSAKFQCVLPPALNVAAPGGGGGGGGGGVASVRVRNQICTVTWQRFLGGGGGELPVSSGGASRLFSCQSFTALRASISRTCWGYAKRLYQLNPDHHGEDHLERNA